MGAADKNMSQKELFEEVEVKRPPIRYHGGKFRLSSWIIPEIPEHSYYVEPFGGAAGVLLRKKRSSAEVYNDLDSQVVNLFRVLRDPATSSSLCSKIDMTPFSREEFIFCYDPCADPVEAARRFIVRCYFGFGSDSSNPNSSAGFSSCDMRANKSYAKAWDNLPESLWNTALRFKGVAIENVDFRKLIPKFS